MTPSHNELAFSIRLNQAASETDALLRQLLSEKPADGETMRPARLTEAMRYAAVAGGKKLRPFLVLQTAALFGVPAERALMAGAAIECVHSYSLVHDDLPAMDNDAMRRGRPTLHKAFDEATAILAGDCLLTFAFDILARSETHPDGEVRSALILGLARAAGIGGMAGGQMLDLAAEGRFAYHGQITYGEYEVTVLQGMKTGALLRFACFAGATLGKAAAPEREAIARYGRAIGQAFQIADDLLDVEGDPEIVGKATGKDAASGKATLVGILGAEGARARLSALVAEAEAALEIFGGKAAVLKSTAQFVAKRRR
jgi:farnesyl diphosphate synthase